MPMIGVAPDYTAFGVLEELKEAGLESVKKTSDGSMLDPKYLLKLLNFINLTSLKRRAADRNEALERRLQLYKDQQDDEYRTLVKEQIEKDDKMSQQVMQELMEVLADTSEQEFTMTM